MTSISVSHYYLHMYVCMCSPIFVPCFSELYPHVHDIRIKANRLIMSLCTGETDNIDALRQPVFCLFSVISLIMGPSTRIYK